MIRTSVSLIALVAAELLLVSAASAQAQPAPATGTTAPPAAVAAADDTGGIADIVVTATRRETNLQQTPISISVVNDQAIRDRNVRSLLDLADGAVPSLRIATFEARQSALTIGIRGIVPLDANQPAREQGVGVYIDGVYLGRQHGLNAALFDVERIEVLKGPQGTLFGRNTSGGALSIVTKAPTGRLGADVIAGIGNLDTRYVQAHVNLPEFANFSIKVDGVYQHQGPTTENPLAGQAGWGYYDRLGGRVAVRWQPAPNVTNDFAVDVSRDKNTPFYSQLLNYNPNGCLSGGTNAAPLPIPPGSACVLPGTAFTGTSGTIRPLLPGVLIVPDRLQRVADIGVPQRPSFDDVHGFTNNFRWSISDAVELRSITAWRGVDVEQFDNSGGAHRVPVVNLTAACAGANCAFSRYSLADLRQRQFSQELQAVGTIGRFDYVAGLFYFIENVSDDAATPNSMGATAIVTNGVVTGATYAPIPFCTGTNRGLAGNAVNGCSIDRASQVRSRSYAAYGQVVWNLTDQFNLTLGGRYTIDKKQGELVTSRNLAYRNPDGTLTSAAIANNYTPLDQEFRRFNPLVTLAYSPADDVNLYAKYATGYRSGGASSRTSNYQGFGPEDVKSYEVGLKTDLFDRTVRFNLAAYLMDRKNSQVDLSTIQPTATGNFNNLVTINAPGTTKIRGIEADVTIRPTERLTLGASYAYTYTRIPLIPVTYVERTPIVNTGGVITGGVATGNVTTVPQQFFIVFTPRNAASGSIDYVLPVGRADAEIRFHLDANYAQATQTFDQFAIKADPSFIVNGRISLANVSMGGNARVQFSLWGRNLLNEQYVYRRDPSNSLPAVQTTAVTGVPNILRVGSNANILGDYGNFNVPRTFGVEARLQF